VRLFVRVSDSPARAKRHASKTGMVHQCVQCESFFVQKFGEVEEGKDIKFKPAKVVTPGSECPACSSERMPELPGITSWKKITGLLTAMSEEYGDLALYYKLPNLCKVLKVNQVPLRQFRGTLDSLGYRVSHFHREPQGQLYL
ncbi:tRNA (guanine(26)-N(2))-dimethyltransferase, partial [Symbiodinium microadriaticum]